MEDDCEVADDDKDNDSCEEKRRFRRHWCVERPSNSGAQGL